MRDINISILYLVRLITDEFVYGYSQKYIQFEFEL